MSRRMPIRATIRLMLQASTLSTISLHTQSPGQEMGVAHPGIDRAERVFDRATARGHGIGHGPAGCPWAPRYLTVFLIMQRQVSPEALGRPSAEGLLRRV